MMLKAVLLSLTLLAVPLTGWAQENASADNSQATLPLNTETHAIEQLSSVPETVVSGVQQPTEEASATDVLATSTWWNDALALLETGGTVVVILLLMSLVAMTIVLMKLIQFQRAGLWQRKPARQGLALWQQGKQEEALQLAAVSRNPTAQAMAQAIRGITRQLPEPLVREEVLRYGCNALFQLRRGLRPLEVIGSLSPLLGLLGTVMGMIAAFQQLQAAGNKVNPAILSGGIWEALLTTAVGLCVAIPVVALLNYLERRVDHLAHEMDNLVTQLFTPELSAASTYQAPSTVVTPLTASNKQARHASAL
ncbi:MotA/TolQ/ExbB proton channel family protein [Shewanella septentrionalis]|uniref:MotA/TolQ/ExbB proton channel family protein n=1 Tax=Shewanella septentrionalis TaxID=2952223 RepID=A0A9X2WTS5_9GAMM|nr:MotA/TolQ/ExbB proton channel family protein [Shewanella septentrionalis]MCT7945206.1 MotA/TolQ/ExbB proton channel family protein [Shewanella septentrionalis]